MKIIKSKQCINKLREKKSLKPEILDCLEEYFQHLMNTFRENESEEEFTLSLYGIIVFLESTDDVKNLPEAALHPEHDGLLGVCPEFVNKITLSPSEPVSTGEKPACPTYLYHTFVLLDNECGNNYFSEVGSLNEKAEEFLAEYVIDEIQEDK